MWHFNKKLRAYILQIHTKSVAEHIVKNLGIEFNPKKFNKYTRMYTYLKPETPEQTKIFNNNRVEFREDRQKKMLLNSSKHSASVAERVKFKVMLENDREMPQESSDLQGSWTI